MSDSVLHVRSMCEKRRKFDPRVSRLYYVVGRLFMLPSPRSRQTLGALHTIQLDSQLAGAYHNAGPNSRLPPRTKQRHLNTSVLWFPHKTLNPQQSDPVASVLAESGGRRPYGLVL